MYTLAEIWCFFMYQNLNLKTVHSVQMNFLQNLVNKTFENIANFKFRERKKQNGTYIWWN